MSETNQFGFSSKEARKISHANSLPGELKRVEDLIKMFANKGEYRMKGVLVKLCHVDAIVDSLCDAGYIVWFGHLNFDQTERSINIDWEDPT